MNRTLIALGALLGMIGSFVHPTHAAESTPIPLIFDTDIGNDVDDALALGMIHSMQTRGDVELLAVTITKDHPLASAFTDAINTFYGRGEIPIGICQSKVTPHEGRFLGLANVRNEDGSLRYPHDWDSGSESPSSVMVLRKALASAKDHSVVIVQVGFSTNLANLLSSPPDELSDLHGTELVSKKVRLLSVMGGAFEQMTNDKGERYDHKEYNIVEDIPSAQKLNESWPTPIWWSGYEIGKALPYPHRSIQEDYDYVLHHPLAESYILYQPPPHDRPTWDLTSVLQAVWPERGYFKLSPRGQVTIQNDGLTTFVAVEEGRDRILMLDESMKPRIVESLQLLSSEPPKGD